MSYSSQPSYPPAPTQPTSDSAFLRLMKGAVIGLVVAVVLMPVHSLVVSMTYHDGYYTDYPQLLALLPVMIAMAVRFGSKTKGVLVALISVGLAVIFLAGSEFLVARFLLNQQLVAEGYEALPVIVDFWTFARLLVLYIQDDPTQTIIWLAAVAIAVFISFSNRLGYEFDTP